MEDTRPIGFVVFGCLTVPKYKEQVIDCWKTWAQDAIDAGCLVRFYVGEIPDDIDPALREVCVNIDQGDSYMSATFKQWRGLEHMVTTLPPCKLYFTAGTDTFVNIDGAMELVETYKNFPLVVIGGGKGCEEVEGHRIDYFTGGAGIFISQMALLLILDDLPEFMPRWISSTMEPKGNYITPTCIEYKVLLAASDLQLGCLCHQHPQIEWISLPDRMWGDRTYKGEGVDRKTLISCHHMKHDDFYEYYTA